MKKKIFAFVALLLLSSFVLLACNAGDNGGEDTTAGKEESVEPMDFSEMDLSPYISLGQYKEVPVAVKESAFLASLHEIMRDDKAYCSLVTDGSYTPSATEDVDVIVDETRVVKEGDIINVDYKGFLDGVAFDGGTATDQEITVFESGAYIDGFAVGFVGTAVGDKSSFNVTFPKNYGAEALAGEEVTFEFTVNYIYEFDALTDEIAEDLSDGEFKTVTGYENHLRTKIVQEKLWVEIVANATLIEYPEDQVKYYYQQNRSFYEYYAKQYGTTYEGLLSKMGLTDADLLEDAKKLVREDLVHYAILKAEGINLSDAECEEKLDVYINRYVEQFGYTEKEVREKLLDSIYDAMLYDKLQETLVSWADVTWE